MTRPRRTRLDDPTAESTADAVPERNRAEEQDDLIRRTADRRVETPRRYEQPADEDPVMPSDDSTLKTKI